MKPIRFTHHAKLRAEERGATEAEVIRAIGEGAREPVRENRFRCRLNVQFQSMWQGKHYDVKQVAPVVVETEDEFVVVTVYTFYF